MKKASYIIIAVIIVAGAIGLVSVMNGPGVTARTSDPFTFDYKTTAEGVKSVAGGDDMATLLASSPFYAGAQPSPGQQTQEFDSARARKVDAIIADSDRLADAAIKLKPRVDEMRKALCDYLTVCGKNDPKAATFASTAGREMLRLYTLEAVVEAQYKSIDTTSTNPFTRSHMQYIKTARAVQLGAVYLQDVDDMVSFAAIGIGDKGAAKNPKIAEADATLDAAMAGFDGMKGDVGDVISDMRKVNYGFKQLATGDYYYARTAVKFMRDSMPKLKAAAANMKPNQCMDADAVAATKDYLAKFDNFSANFQRYLDSAPKSKLLPITFVAPATPGCAFAQGKDMPNDYGTAILAVSKPAEVSNTPSKGWISTGWSGFKGAVHGTQSVIGVGIDMAGVTVKNLSRIGTGIYYGNSIDEIWTDMKVNTRVITENWNNNQSGSSTLHTAKQYLDAVDKGAEYVGESGAQKVFGEGWTSWGVGKIAGAASSIFTGLGKGIVLVGNRDSQASDYVIGGIEIGSAFLGGSKLVLRGTQLPGFLTGLGKGSWISAEATYNAVGKMMQSIEQSNIDNAIKWAAKSGFEASYASRQAIKDAMLAAIEKSNQALKERFASLVDEGIQAGWANFNKTLHESLHDFIKEKFVLNAKGISQALATALGKNAADFGDNIVAQWAEDVLKELVDQAMAESPLPQELKGEWTGTTVFTSVQVPESTGGSAGKEGCDIGAAIKALQGKSLPTTLRLDGSRTGSGAMTLQLSANGKEGSPIGGRYNYLAGVLNVNQGVQGGVLSMQGAASRMTQGYSIKGPIAFLGTGKAAGVHLTGSFHVSKER